MQPSQLQTVGKETALLGSSVPLKVAGSEYPRCTWNSTGKLEIKGIEKSQMRKEYKMAGCLPTFQNKKPHLARTRKDSMRVWDRVIPNSGWTPSIAKANWIKLVSGTAPVLIVNCPAPIFRAPTLNGDHSWHVFLFQVAPRLKSRDCTAAPVFHSDTLY